MGDLLGVTVKDLVGVLKDKQARIPFEIGAFVALETCEALLPGPAAIRLTDVRVADDGTVSVFAPPNSATGAEAAKSVVALLAHLLVAAGSGVPPVLVELVERGPSDGRWDLERLRDELEASLVPLNRQAARRVLSRMLREAQRDADADDGPEAPDDDALDAELDALMGDGKAGGNGAAEPDMDAELDALMGDADADAGPTNPYPKVPDPVPAKPPQVLYEPASVQADLGDSRGRGDEIWPADPSASEPVKRETKRRADDSLATTLDRGVEADDAPVDGPPPPIPNAPFSEPPPPEAFEALTPVQHVDSFDASPTTQPRRRREIDLSGLEELQPKSKKPLLLAVLFLVLSAALLFGVAMFRPDAIDRILGRETPEERLAEQMDSRRAEEQARIEAEHAGRFGELMVHVSPPESQILLFVGRGPAEATQLPPGIAHEFIVIAEGKSPARAIVAPDAEWEESDDGPRYELAVVAGDEDMSFEELELGETRLPREMGTPSMEVGVVRIVTAPRDAKVYQLIGFAPNARIENTVTDEPHELLVWSHGHIPQRVIVGPSDWQDTEEGSKTARVDVTLEPREGFDPEEDD